MYSVIGKIDLYPRPSKMFRRGLLILVYGSKFWEKLISIKIVENAIYLELSLRKIAEILKDKMLGET